MCTEAGLDFWVDKSKSHSGKYWKVILLYNVHPEEMETALNSLVASKQWKGKAAERFTGVKYHSKLQLLMEAKYHSPTASPLRAPSLLFLITVKLVIFISPLVR